MKAQKLLEKLEKYEQAAYDGSCGEDWHIGIGEGFKLFVKDCIENGSSVTIAGFVKWIDNLAETIIDT